MASVHAIDTIDEETPLLQRAVVSPPSADEAHEARLWRTRILVLLFLLVGNLLGAFFDFPEFILIQEAVCVQMYRRTSIQSATPFVMPSPEDCLADEVQIRLAYIISYRDIFFLIPILLTTLPYSRLADTWGRKPVLLMAATGDVLGSYWVPIVNYLIVQKGYNLDARLVWASSLWLFLGGGPKIVSTVVHAIIVDVSHEDQRFREFSFLTSATMIPLIFSDPLATWITGFGKWTAYWIGLPVIAISFTCIMMLPETLHQTKLSLVKATNPLAGKPDPIIEETERLLNEEDEETETETETETEVVAETVPTSPVSQDPPIPHLNRNRLIIFCIVFFHDTSFRLVASNTIQFCTKILGWTLQETSFVPSVHSAMSLAITALILPIVHQRLYARTSQRLSSDASPRSPSSSTISIPRATTLMISVICLSLYIGGSLIKGLIISTPAYLLATIMTPFSRGTTTSIISLGSSLYTTHQQAQFHARVGLLDIVGSAIAGLIAPRLFALGLSWGGVWVGSMYWVGAISAIICLTILMLGRGGLSRAAAIRTTDQ